MFPPARPAPTLPGLLEVRLDLIAGRLTLTGRLDRTTAHLVHDGCPLLLTTDHAVWVLDATGLEVGDHVGLRSLGAAYRRLLRHGRRLQVVGPSAALLRDPTRLRLDRHLLIGEPTPA